MRLTVACALAGLLALPAAAQVTLLTGRVEYLDKAWDYDGWTGADVPRPVRRADVFVLDNLTLAVLAQGSTAQDGSFALSVPLLTPKDLLVRIDADSDLDGSFQRVRVTTETNVEYSLFSPVLLGVLPVPLLDIGTLLSLPVLSGTDEGSPFNLFDMGVATAEYVTGPPVGAAPSTQTIRLYWPTPGGSFATSNQAHISSDDGFDDAVILHELGHVIQHLYSDSDSPGGAHNFGDSDQDPQLSFGEGYATFFAGTVLDSLGMEALYQDCSATAQVGGSQLRARLETVAPYALDSFGAADELAVACALFDLLDDEQSPDATPGLDDDGFVSGTQVAGLSSHRAWWDVFTGPVAAAANLTQNDAWDGWLAEHAADPHLPELQAVFEDRRQRFWPDGQEPDNDPSLAALLPAVTGTTWSDERTLFWTEAVPPAPGTGDADWYAVPLVVGDVVDVVTRYPGAAEDADTQCDTFIDLFSPQGALLASAEDGGTGRNARIDDYAVPQTGTYTYRVRTTSVVRRYGRYEVRTRYESQNHPPVIVSGPDAAPQQIDDEQTALLSVVASDEDAGQTLAYAWTPLDGGSILGAGPAVTFFPPPVAAPTLVRVGLVVSDSLGAQAPAAEVQLTVVPAAGPCTGAAAVATGGSAKPGAFGPPSLSALNLPVLPSGDFALHATGCHPLKAATLVVGFGLLGAPYDQGHLYPSPDLLLGVFTSAAGELLLPVPLGADPLLCGLTLYMQVLVPGDPGAAGAKQTSQTNWLSLTFGA